MIVEEKIVHKEGLLKKTSCLSEVISKGINYFYRGWLLGK